MPYGNFASVSDVARLFDIEVIGNKYFVDTLPAKIPAIYFQRIERKLSNDLNFINETTICERIISPMLELVADCYDTLEIWSHVPYNVDKEKGLVGEPDYLIAPTTKYGDMGVPSLCIVEAKRDNFAEGWRQALAEMVAASLQGSTLCYSAVTTGNTWEFGKLEGKVFVKEAKKFSAAVNLQEVFDVLNWIFSLAASQDNKAL